MKDQKKLSDRTWVVLLGIAASIVAIFVFITGRNLPDIITDSGDSPSSNSDTLASNPTVIAIDGQASPGALEDSGPRPGVENNQWSGHISVRKPTLNEIREEDPVSLWDANLIDVQDMHKPGIDTYSGSARLGTEYLFPVYWCSTSSDLLVENMDQIKTEIVVNGEIVPEKYVFVFDFETPLGWVCRYHAAVLGDWTIDVEYVLEIRRIFAEDLFDGESTYAPGEYVYRLLLDVY